MINAFDPIHDPAWEAYVSRHSISLSYPDNHMFLGSIDYASAARLLMIRGSATLQLSPIVTTIYSQTAHKAFTLLIIPTDRMPIVCEDVGGEVGIMHEDNMT